MTLAYTGSALSFPPPRNPGLPGFRINSAQVGQARLAVGEGQGGGPLAHESAATPLPNPPHKGGGSSHEQAAARHSLFATFAPSHASVAKLNPVPVPAGVR
jgi:hypothetical protein